MKHESLITRLVAIFIVALMIVAGWMNYRDHGIFAALGWWAAAVNSLVLEMAFQALMRRTG